MFKSSGSHLAGKLEIAAPNVNARRPSCLLRTRIRAMAVPDAVQSIAALDEPPIYFAAVGAKTDTDEPLISIALSDVAPDGRDAARINQARLPRPFRTDRCRHLRLSIFANFPAHLHRAAHTVACDF